MTTKLQKAIAALERGDKETGKELLTELLRANSRNEMAWLWMAQAVESKAQRRECLARVLTINPNNEQAWKALTTLNRAAAAAPAQTPPLPAKVGPPATPLPAPMKSPPRRPDRPASRGYSPLWTLWMLVFLLLGAGIYVGQNLETRWEQWVRFAYSGVTTNGTVVDKRIDANGRHYITYRFDAPVPGRDIGQFQTEQRVEPFFYQYVKSGQLIRIQYLFEEPATVRIQGNDDFAELVLWSLMAVLAVVAAAVPPLVGLVLGLKQWRPSRSSTGGGHVLRRAGAGIGHFFQSIFRFIWFVVGGVFKILWLIVQTVASWLIAIPSRLFPRREPERPAIIWEGEGPAPFKQWSGSYTLGQNNYLESFVIETEDGTFLGEGGMEVFRAVPDTDPQQVLAFDVGVFDKTDTTTRSYIVMTQQAYNDDPLQIAIETNPDARPLLAETGQTFTLQSKAMRLECVIEEAAFAEDGYFERLTISMNIFLKEGVDIEKPMAIPDQYK